MTFSQCCCGHHIKVMDKKKDIFLSMSFLGPPLPYLACFTSSCDCQCCFSVLPISSLMCQNGNQPTHMKFALTSNALPKVHKFLTRHEGSFILNNMIKYYLQESNFILFFFFSLPFMFQLSQCFFLGWRQTCEKSISRIALPILSKIQIQTFRCIIYIISRSAKFTWKLTSIIIDVKIFCFMLILLCIHVFYDWKKNK